jgi:hypothetical protein
MKIKYESYDGLSYESKESCLRNEIFFRELEMQIAFNDYVEYRGKVHIKICEEYFFIGRQKIEDFEKERPLFSKPARIKMYWERRNLLKRRLKESTKLLKALRKDWQKKQELLKKAQTELEKVQKLINKSKESKKK